MKRRLKIYFVHSLKYDYNNMLYRDLLTDSVLNKHELMLPMSNAYKEKYSKDLINKADLIVCEVSTPSFTEKLELKWVSKVSTPKLYFSFNNTVPKTFSKYVPAIEYTNNDKSYLDLIRNFVNEYSQISEEEAKDPTIILGSLDQVMRLEMKVNDFKCKNCGATLVIPDGSRKVVCDYCNTSYDVEDAYSEAYKYHKGMMDASSEKFEKQFKMVNDAFNNDPMFKISKAIFIIIFVVIFVIIAIVFGNILTGNL